MSEKSQQEITSIDNNSEKYLVNAEEMNSRDKVSEQSDLDDLKNFVAESEAVSIPNSVRTDENSSLYPECSTLCPLCSLPSHTGEAQKKVNEKFASNVVDIVLDKTFHVGENTTTVFDFLVGGRNDDQDAADLSSDDSTRRNSHGSTLSAESESSVSEEDNANATNNENNMLLDEIKRITKLELLMTSITDNRSNAILEYIIEELRGEYPVSYVSQLLEDRIEAMSMRNTNIRRMESVFEEFQEVEAPIDYESSRRSPVQESEGEKDGNDDEEKT